MWRLIICVCETSHTLKRDSLIVSRSAYEAGALFLPLLSSDSSDASLRATEASSSESSESLPSSLSHFELLAGVYGEAIQ